MTSKRDRVRAQVKSRWYYAFWGTGLDPDDYIIWLEVDEEV